RGRATVADDAAKTVRVAAVGAAGARSRAQAARSIAISPAVTLDRMRRLPSRKLDDDVGRLHHRDGPHARRQTQLVGRLARDQGHEAMRPGLDLDLGGDPDLAR